MSFPHCRSHIFLYIRHFRNTFSCILNIIFREIIKLLLFNCFIVIKRFIYLILLLLNLLISNNLSSLIFFPLLFLLSLPVFFIICFQHLSLISNLLSFMERESFPSCIFFTHLKLLISCIKCILTTFFSCLKIRIIF